MSLSRPLSLQNRVFRVLGEGRKGTPTTIGWVTFYNIFTMKANVLGKHPHDPLSQAAVTVFVS
jgi:hypothetical protein